MRINELFENEEWEPPINPNLWDELNRWTVNNVLGKSGFNKNKTWSLGKNYPAVPRTEEDLENYFRNTLTIEEYPNLKTDLENLIKDWGPKYYNLDITMTGANDWIFRLASTKLDILNQGSKTENSILESKKKLRGSITFTPYRGADVDDRDFDQLPIVNLKVDDIILNEPYKMNDPQNRRKVLQLKKKIKKGETPPPILVRELIQKYQVLDGHHRLEAYRLLNRETIPAQIVPNANIKKVWPKNRSL